MEKSMALQIIEAAFECVLLPLLIWVIREITSTLREKAKNEKVKKYVGLVGEIVTDAVQTVSQTYVEALKEQEAFDENAQRTAFERAMNIVKAQITDDAAKALTEAFGDVDTYLTSKIEATVRNDKLLY